MTIRELIGWNPKHLGIVNESYLQHLKWTVRSFFHLITVAVVGLIHGLIPVLFADTPDRLALPWVRAFLARRKLTGQEVLRPLEEKE